MSASISVERKSRASTAARTSEGPPPPPPPVEEVEVTATTPTKPSDIAIVKFSKDDQEALKITIGIHLTIDRPWKTVSKELLLAKLEGKEPRVIRKLSRYKFSEVLVGYQASMEGNDNHMVCLTERGRERVLGELSQLHNTLAERVRQYLNRTPHRRPTPKRKVTVAKPQRPPISYEWIGQVSSRPRRVNFGAARETSSYNRILCRNKDAIKLVESAVQHAEVLATPEFQDSPVQTEPEITINDCTQFVPELDLPSFTKLTPEGEAKLARVCKTYGDTVLEATGYNSLFDLYKDDYSELLNLGKPLSIAKTGIYKHFMSFNDISQFEGKILTSLSWHPDETGTVAVSYGNLSANKMVRLESDSEDESYRSRDDLAVWVQKRKVKSVQDVDTKERDSWVRTINRIEVLMGMEFTETQWNAAETTLDTIEMTMKMREFEVQNQKLKEGMIPDLDAGLEEYDMYYLPYGTEMEVNTSLMKSLIGGS